MWFSINLYFNIRINGQVDTFLRIRIPFDNDCLIGDKGYLNRQQSGE